MRALKKDFYLQAQFPQLTVHLPIYSFIYQAFTNMQIYFCPIFNTPFYNPLK